MNQLLYVQGIPFWRNVIVLRWVVQIVSAVLVISVLALFFVNVSREIAARDIPFGYDFLDRAAQIPIGESVIGYDPSDSFAYGLLVAALNTVKVSVLGVILATLLGIVIGIARLSPNWLLNRAALVYIEIFRNIPLLVQLLFWFLIVLSLPTVREGYVAFDAFYLSNSGVNLPWPVTAGRVLALGDPHHRRHRRGHLHGPSPEPARNRNRQGELSHHRRPRHR